MIINLSSDSFYCVIHAYWLYTSGSKRSTASLWIDRNYFFFAKSSYKNAWSSDTVIQLLSLEYQNLATSLPWRNACLCCINSGFGLHLFAPPFLSTGLKYLSSHYWLSQLTAQDSSLTYCRSNTSSFLGGAQTKSSPIPQLTFHICRNSLKWETNSKHVSLSLS